MSITVESFTLGDDSAIAMATNITNLFVEHSFLNLNELETPSSQPKPQPGEPAIYNFKKGEHRSFNVLRIRECPGHPYL